MRKSDFLYPRHSYHGEVKLARTCGQVLCLAPFGDAGSLVKPENLVFNANLQEFSTRINYICGLATNGKLSSQKAYRQIKANWKQLKRSKKQLCIRSASDNGE